jgi:predicted TPR repeat methyltransferase
MRPQPRWKERVKSIPAVVDDIRLPENGDLSQDREFCDVSINGDRKRIRFHDYDQIFKLPGLYEALFYERLGCCSPSRVAALLDDVLNDFAGNAEQLRVLDLGAGNGMVADELHARGVEQIVGIDIIPEARDAARRDRPEVYDDYVVADLTQLPRSVEQELKQHEFNCLISVAALGFGDIPASAFAQALDLVQVDGWLAFTIKEEFLHDEDDSGFARLVSDLNQQRIIQIQALRRFQHRRSVSGEPLYYVAVIARKLAEAPAEMLP